MKWIARFTKLGIPRMDLNTEEIRETYNLYIEMETLQLKILNRSLFVKLNWTLAGHLTVKKNIFGCPVGVSENTLVQVVKDFQFYITVEARVCDTISICGQGFLLKSKFLPSN